MSMVKALWSVAIISCVVGVSVAGAAPPGPPAQHHLFADVLQTATQAQDEGLPGAPLNPYVPPACTGLFADVACPGGFAVNWIEQFYNDGITAGCGTNPLRYCPTTPVTRDQMAVFVEKAMRGTSTWSPGDLGANNTGIGDGALLHNTVAMVNTGVGYRALYTQSYTNAGVGYDSANTAVGGFALYSNQPDGGASGMNGTGNTAAGTESLQSNSIGYANTAVGAASLFFNQDGFYNTAVGRRAGARNGDQITGYAGFGQVFTNTVHGSYNTFIGIAGSTFGDVSNCTAVGMDAYCDNDNEVRLGNFYVTSIGGEVGFSAISDARAKSDIRDLDLGVEFVMALRPVSYRMKGGNGRTDMGFVAQDIEALLGDEYNVLDIGGDKDRTLSLRHTDLIAPLVKAIQEQQAQITDQARTIQVQQAQIEALKTALAERDSALERRLAALEQKK